MCIPFDSSVNAFFLSLQLFIKKNKAIDSENHPDNFFFLLFGGSRVGHGRGRVGWRQPRGKVRYTLISRVLGL